MTAMEKITFNLPSDLKIQVSRLKDDLHMSMSAIYTEAIKQYIQTQEVKKWQKAAEFASKDKEYLKFIDEMDKIEDDFYEY